MTASWILRGSALLLCGLGFSFTLMPACSSEPDSAQPQASRGGQGGKEDAGFDASLNPMGGYGGGPGHGGGSTGAGGGGQQDYCGTGNPTCTHESIGPTGDPAKQFPLPGDSPEPENVEADGVTRDDDGYLALDSTKAAFDFLWVADDMAYGVGFVSKIRTTPFPDPPYYREAARYASVTCSSLSTGNKEGVVLGKMPTAALCQDGVNGCCANDQGPSAAVAVQVVANRPSRTAVDTNGDVWVANRAHDPRFLDFQQPSVTKIANNPDDCIDRNGDGTINTSSDVNGDGMIQTDCNEDNLPDDLLTACPGGAKPEFYGLDDECILFTINTGPAGSVGRPLALGPDQGNIRSFNPSDAWAGTYVDGVFYRVDGKVGVIEQTVTLLTDDEGKVGNPYGATVDKHGILWASDDMKHTLFYFDTEDSSKEGMVQYEGLPGIDPSTVQFYGITMDGFVKEAEDGTREVDQQVWVGEYKEPGAIRYRPPRNAGFEGLSLGTWAHVRFEGLDPQGRGIAADNRRPNSFVWLALDGIDRDTSIQIPNGGHIGRIPADIADGYTPLPDSHAFATSQTITTGVGVAFDLDIWGINRFSHSATHLKFDENGNFVGGPDIIPLDDKPEATQGFCPLNLDRGIGCKPEPYTYSDFTGFGLRNFTLPSGHYSWTQEGCGAKNTRWLRVTWDSSVPAGSILEVQVRSADTLGDLAAATWIGPYQGSPAYMDDPAATLTPNPSGYLEVRFDLSSTTGESPKLKSFQVIYECVDEDIPQ